MLLAISAAIFLDTSLQAFKNVFMLLGTLYWLLSLQHVMLEMKISGRATNAFEDVYEKHTNLPLLGVLSPCFFIAKFGIQQGPGRPQSANKPAATKSRLAWRCLGLHNGTRTLTTSFYIGGQPSWDADKGELPVSYWPS